MNRIAIIGPRGSGKSTVGPLVAASLGWPFIDNDATIEAIAGKTVARIFAEDGEPAFRDLEAAALAENLKREPLALATGGGAILRPASRALLREACFVVWLDADAATCWRRIEGDAGRPNLTPLGGLAEMEAVLAERRLLYEATAHARVNANESPEAVAKAILALS